MLAIDLMEELAWEDFLTPVADNAYRLKCRHTGSRGAFRSKKQRKECLYSR